MKKLLNSDWLRTVQEPKQKAKQSSGKESGEEVPRK